MEEQFNRRFYYIQRIYLLFLLFNTPNNFSFKIANPPQLILYHKGTTLSSMLNNPHKTPSTISINKVAAVKSVKETPTRKKDQLQQILKHNNNSLPKKTSVPYAAFFQDNNKENVLSNANTTRSNHAPLIQLDSSPLRNQRKSPDTQLFQLKPNRTINHQLKRDDSTSNHHGNSLGNKTFSVQPNCFKVKITLNADSSSSNQSLLNKYDGKRKFSCQPNLNTIAHPSPATSHSSLECSISGSLDQVRNNNQEKNCYAHPNKKAMFEAFNQEEECIACCKNCGIFMAGKGLTIREIQEKKATSNSMPNPGSSNIHLNDRAHVLNGFLDRIKTFMPLIRRESASLQKMRLLTNANYEKELRNLNNYYQEIFKLLVSMKEDGENELREIKDHIIAQIDSLDQNLAAVLEETEDMKNDISPNIPQIMNSTESAKKVDEEKFREIMSIYNSKLDEFHQQIEEMSKFKPHQIRLQLNYQDKLQNCLESLPYFKLETHSSSPPEKQQEIQIPERQFQMHRPLLIAATEEAELIQPEPSRNKIPESMYFSFEDRSRIHSTSSSHKKSSQKKQILPEVVIKEKKPFVRLFQEYQQTNQQQQQEEPKKMSGEKSPTFKPF